EDAPERRYIKILNPISEDLSVMRTTLAPSMINLMIRNMKKGNYEGCVYELAKVYLAKELPIKDFPEERRMLCIGMWGACTFFELKGVCEAVAESLNVKFTYEHTEKSFLHPGITAKILCEGQEVGYLGLVNPPVSEALAAERPMLVAEINYEILCEHAKPFRYSPLPHFPEAQRDLALIADKEITCEQIENEIRSACKYVTDVKLFDIYSGNQIAEGKKSMAYTLTFTPKDEALTGEKIDGFVKKILSNLQYKLNVVLR
ncbi:MAG: phenylalanine--tRNA ligase subunit beta, partial [Clostridia bacterium]|nr:phenylalanine--tRNA ligase subunit beta [Clostridia bacterium]